MKRTNRIRLTESQLHKVIKESVNQILAEEDYGYEYDYVTKDGKGIGKKHKVPLSGRGVSTTEKRWDSEDGKHEYVSDYEYADKNGNPIKGTRKTRKFVKESQLRQIVKESVANVLNEIRGGNDNPYRYKYGERTTRDPFDPYADVKDPFDPNDDKRGDFDLTEGLDEAFNNLQYANFAGQANGALSTVGGKIKGFFNPQWKARKQRQEKKFADAAKGSAPSQNYMRNDDYNVQQYANATNNGKYDYDFYANSYNPCGGFEYKRHQGYDNPYGRDTYGSQHGQKMNHKDFENQERERLGDNYWDSDSFELSKGNQKLNQAYQNGRGAAMGKIGKSDTNFNGQNIGGTGMQNGYIQNHREGNH